MKITYATVKNTKLMDKPNEDIFLCDGNNGIFLLLDGVSRDRESGRYPNPSPAVDVVHILKDEIYNYLISHRWDSQNILDLIVKAVKIANNKVKIYNDRKKLLFAAGAVGIIAIIDKGQLFYAYIGDCFGRIVYDNNIVVFTHCQTELINKHKKEFSAFEIREIICNNPVHPYSYGVLNGDEQAIYFLQTGKIDLFDVKCIILTSDGIEPFLSSCSAKFLHSKNAISLLEKDQEIQTENQDDKTIIKIDMEYIDL